ncbi:hypothetical protein BDAP_002070 [Binucleata daphniae]
MSLSANWKRIKSYIAEGCASFLFGFVVYSAILSSNITDQVSTPVIVGLAIAFASIAIIYTFVDVTVAHFNPAITFAAIFFGKLPIIRGFIYIIFQFLGFMVAAAVILGCFPQGASDKLNIIRAKKQADASTGNLICTELFLTGILVFVAFQVAINVYKKPKITKDEGSLPNPGEVDESPDKTILAPLVIGLTLGFLAFLGFGSSGGVYNPGLVFPPVLYTGDWYDSWAYWVAQFVGGLVGAAIQVIFVARTY